MVLKAAGIVLLGVVGLLVLQTLYQSFSLSPGMSGIQSLGGYGSSVSTKYAVPAYDADYVMEETSLSYRNVASEGMPVPRPGDNYVSGNDAEAYEVTSYHAEVETRDATQTCDTILALKEREEVVFENAHEYASGCSYTFKVEKESVSSVLAVIESLDPRELNESTYTIKRQIEDYTSEIDILTEKLNTIEETLASALLAYEEVTALASASRDIESLAKIVDSKMQLIERLTNERIEVTARLERIEASKADELDRLLYTYMTVSVYENEYVDTDALADSWKRAVRNMVFEVNSILESLTVGLVSLAFVILQILLYIFIVVIVAKFTWKGVRKVWQM